MSLLKVREPVRFSQLLTPDDGRERSLHRTGLRHRGGQRTGEPFDEEMTNQQRRSVSNFFFRFTAATDTSICARSRRRRSTVFISRICRSRSS